MPPSRQRRRPRGVLVVTALLGYLAVVILLERTGNRDLLLVFLALGLAVPVLVLVLERNRQGKQIAAMKQAALQAELSALKAQINPHFFFNTLNTLYGMAQQGDVRTAEMIQRLGELMRFTVYEGRKNEVAIGAEIEYLEHYLELSRMRYGRLDDIRFETNIESREFQLPPLLLIVLVENSVKHGAARVADGAFIHLEISVLANRLEVVIENNFDDSPGRGSGIGMQNLRRRLELQYPARHSLTARSTGDVWRAELVLEGRCAI
jgi:LytS/YehU family sensor histidine kinase